MSETATDVEADGVNHEVPSQNDAPPTPHVAQATSSKGQLIVAYAALAISVVAMSSGGIWFALLKDTPPAIKASWRLLVTSLMQAIPFIIQLRKAPPDLKLKWKAAQRLMIFTGFILALHFDAWSLSINLTSLAHSLLFVTSTPILLVALFGARHFVAKHCANGSRWHRGCFIKAADGDVVFPPTLLEVIGTVVGFTAAATLALLTGQESEQSGTGEPSPTFIGDMIALFAAAAVGLYLLVGASLRKWMPIFMYAFPVTLSAAVFSTLLALLFESGAQLSGTGPAAVFGWLGDSDRFWCVVAAAGVSGMLGHTLCNFAIEHVSSLVVTVALLIEPVLGSVMGWLVGVQGVPDAFTIGLGFVLLLGATLVTLGTRGSATNARFEQLLQQFSARWRGFTPQS